MPSRSKAMGLAFLVALGVMSAGCVSASPGPSAVDWRYASSHSGPNAGRMKVVHCGRVAGGWTNCN